MCEIKRTYFRVLFFLFQYKILIFTSGSNRQKKKKEVVADVTSEQVLDANLFGEHSIRSDYWHRCYLLLFSFSSVIPANSYFMLKKEEEHTEVGSFYFTHFLSDTDLAKRVYTFCLLEIFTD